MAPIGLARRAPGPSTTKPATAGPELDPPTGLGSLMTGILGGSSYVLDGRHRDVAAHPVCVGAPDSIFTLASPQIQSDGMLCGTPENWVGSDLPVSPPRRSGTSKLARRPQFTPCNCQGDRGV